MVFIKKKKKEKSLAIQNLCNYDISDGGRNPGVNPAKKCQPLLRTTIWKDFIYLHPRYTLISLKYTIDYEYY